MATARWFFEHDVNSKFVVQEHLRQDYWRAGPAQMWIDAVQTVAPYKAVGYWHDVTFDLEWLPRDYVILRANRKEPELIRATTLQLGFRASREYEADGKHVTEWRVRNTEAASVAHSAATPSN